MIQTENDAFRLQNIIDCTHLGTWEWNVQTGETVFNETWAQIIGYTLAELAPISIKTWEMLAHPDDIRSSGSLLERHFAKELLYYDLECRMKHKDGHWVWVHDRGKVISWTADGKPLKMFGTHSDITARKQAEEALQKNELKYRLLIEKSAGITYTMNLEGVYTFISENITQFLGYSAGKLIGKSFRDYVHPDDIPMCIANLENAITAGLQSSNIEFRIRHADGSWRWHCANPNPMREESGAVFGFIGFCIDITARRQAEDALAAEKEHLAVTLRSIGDGVITTDTLGNVVIMNKVAEELCGWKNEEAQGRRLSSVFKIINEVTRLPHENPVEKVLSSGEIIELANHTLLIARDGTERFIADCGAPIKDKSSRTIGVVLVFRDVTEKQRLTDTLQRTQKLEALGVLAGGIAHDFNNLLGGIFGNIDMAAEGTMETTTAKYLERAMGALNRARALTGQLLTFAKGGEPVKKFDHLIPFIEETTKFALSGSNVSTRFSFTEDLWQCEFDKNQIGQVVDNIVINALQAMPDGGTLEVTAENMQLYDKAHPTLLAGNYAKIAFKDNGIGMPKKILPKIFDPFFTTKAKGHGLGLATCYSIIKRHGGCIDVESEPDKGSTFTIYIPASPEASNTETATTLAMHKGSGSILVMDDEGVIRDIISSMLDTMGYHAQCVSDSKEAIELFGKALVCDDRFVALILDLTIPGGPGGKETIRKIREVDKDIPAFVASGYADDPVMANPEEYGFNGSICKPFRKSELAELLNMYMKKVK